MARCPPLAEITVVRSDRQGRAEDPRVEIVFALQCNGLACTASGGRADETVLGVEQEAEAAIVQREVDAAAEIEVILGRQARREDDCIVDQLGRFSIVYYDNRFWPDE